MSDEQTAPSEAEVERFTRELARVLQRLEQAPERHWAANAVIARGCSTRLRALDLALGAEGPATVPVIADRAVAAQLSVIANDLMQTARHHLDGAPSLAIAADDLANVRRELP